MLRPKKSLENIELYDVPLFEEEWNLKLDMNENLFGPSEKVLNAIRNLEAKDIKFYPLYGEISQKIADFTGFKSENIKVTNGADEAIYSIFQTYLNPEDKVLTVTPTFSMPFIYAKVVGSDVEKVPYETRWEFPINKFLEKISDKNIKVVYLTTPNSPTGEVISSENIDKILELSADKVVLIDETYGNYCNSSYKELVKKYDNVFIVKSFSKDFALAGLRLGYIISSKENIKQIKSVVSPFSVNSVAAIAGIAALEDYSYFENIKIEIEKSKNILKEGFEKLGATVFPSKTNFLCVDFGDKAEFIQKKLINQRIIIKKLADCFGGFIYRVTAPRPEDAMKVVNALEIKDTIVFDMDGVLIDASKSYRIAVKKTFEFFAKKELSFEKIQQAKNMGGLNNDWDLTEFLLNNENIKVDKEVLIDKFQDFYWDEGKGLINNEDLLIDKDFLNILSQKYNLAIFTGRPRQEADYALKRNGISDYFYPVVTMDDLPLDRQKPDILGLEVIKNKIVTDKIFYIGDTMDDVIVAKNAGVMSIAVLPPQDKSQTLKGSLKEHGAIMILDNVNQINNALEINYEIQL